MSFPKTNCPHKKKSKGFFHGHLFFVEGSLHLLCICSLGYLIYTLILCIFIYILIVTTIYYYNYNYYYYYYYYYYSALMTFSVWQTPRL